MPINSNNLSERSRAVMAAQDRKLRAGLKIYADIIAILRVTIPVMQDRGLPAPADNLSEQMHLHDCEEAELQKIMHGLMADGDGVAVLMELLTASTGSADNAGHD